ncbi:UNVERIFIED_CONTAM: SAM-dependent methyltransferase [Brevibacillus sp. OAP136]
MANLYENTAFLYDRDPRIPFSMDIPFYVKQAEKAKGPVLELACGTGRVLLPLAQQGFQVWGIDLSEAMLTELERKKSRLPVDIQQRIHVSRQSMCDFSIRQQFSLIFAAFRSFQALSTEDEALSCLKTCYRHLHVGGRLLINVFRLSKPMGDWWQSKEEKLDFETMLPGGEIMTRYSFNKSFDPILRLLEVDLIYRIQHKEKPVKEHRDKLRLRYYEGDDLRTLLRDAGFTIEAEYGGYAGQPIEQGNELLFICHK